MSVISGIARSPRLIALVALFGLLLFVETSEIRASSTTIGNALILRSDKNALAGGVYASVQPFGASAVGGSLTTWSFFAHTGTVGRKITPLLLESVGGNQYVLRAIGQTRSAAPGLNSSLAFTVQAGNGTINNVSNQHKWDTLGAERSGAG